jgi:hypothetical protein
MPNQEESYTLPHEDPIKKTSSGWARVGIVAAASALVGGLAVAWYYRNTLKTLRQTEENSPNPDFGSAKKDTEYEI